MSDFGKDIKLLAFDLDGTIYMGESLIDGVKNTIAHLQKRYHIIFFTNNSSKSRKDILEKLTNLELKTTLDNIYTASYATAAYLKDYEIDNIFMIGSEGLRNEIISQGINIINNESAEHLVVGMDFNFNINKIGIALSILFKKGKFIACNEDKYFPIAEGKFAPGCAAIVGAIASCSERSPDIIAGKPNTFLLKKITEKFCLNHNQILVIGDSIDSDIKMALNFKSKAILFNCEDHINNKNVVVIKHFKEIENYL
jgi:4-nitrophenyl phosphatase